MNKILKRSLIVVGALFVLYVVVVMIVATMVAKKIEEVQSELRMFQKQSEMYKYRQDI